MIDGTDPWDWDEWLQETDQHVSTLKQRLTANAILETGGDLEKMGSPGLINPETGHTVGGRLCSVCFSTFPHTGRMLPTFRSCWWCLAYDKAQAQKLGLKMLLPLMDWHCQPILPGQRFPTHAGTVELLKAIWSSSALLEDWRYENVKREYALMAEPGNPPIHLYDWMQRFGYGLPRSRKTWWAFADLYFPEIREILKKD
jgi:hypothetical protein